MPNNDELTRADYIRALLGNKNQYVAQGGNMLNPALSNDISGLAALDTSFNGVQPQEQPKQEKQPNGFDQFMNNVLGFVDEIAAKFGAGFVNGWEGILDFGATALGAMGWEAAAEWAKQDIGSAAAEWSKTAFGLGAWYNRLRGNSSPNEFGDIISGLGDLGKAAFFAKNDLGDMRELSDKHYKANDEALQDMGQFGEFLGGAAHSIGFMLPSIMTAGAAAGAGSAAQQAVSLGTMGLGAAGKGSEEALNDGATSGQALGYGALSGTAEVASELVVGKALGLVGLGTGKIAGVVGKGTSKTTAKVGSKLFAKQLTQTMFEEGMEEVSTAVLEPLFKSVYKGKESLEDYKSMDFWFGSDGHFNESVLGQFTSGAFVGGLSGGIHQSAVYRKVGADGYVALQNFQNLSEEDAKMAKLEVQKKTDGKAYTEATNARTEAMEEFIKSVDKLMQNGTEAQKKAFAEFLTNKNTVAKWEKEDKNLESNISKFVDKFASHESAEIESFRNEMNRRFGTDFEYEIEKGDIKTDSEGRKLTAYIDGNKIVINENVIKQKGGSKIAHEYMAHHLLKSLPSEVKSKLFRDVQNTEWYKNNKEEIDDLYGDQTKAVYNEEAFALYMEHVFEGDNVAIQIENMRQVFGSKGLFSGLQRILRGAKKFKSPELIKQYAKTLDKVTKAMIKSKIYSREDLSDFIKQVDELKQLAEQPAYSKESADEKGKRWKYDAQRAVEKGRKGLRSQDISSGDTSWEEAYDSSSLRRHKGFRNQIADIFSGKDTILDNKTNFERYRTFLQNEDVRKKAFKFGGKGMLNPEFYTPEMVAFSNEMEDLGSRVFFMPKSMLSDAQAQVVNDKVVWVGIDTISSDQIIEVLRHERQHFFQTNYSKEYINYFVKPMLNYLFPAYAKRLGNEIYTKYLFTEHLSPSVYKELVESYGEAKSYKASANDENYKIGRRIYIQDNIELYGIKGISVRDVAELPEPYAKKMYMNFRMLNEVMSDLYGQLARTERILQENGYSPDEYNEIVNNFTKVIKEKANTDLLFSKESSVTGKYTVGDNKKPLEVRKVAKGYEVVYPSESRTITEAKVGDDTIKFDTVKNIKAYLNDIKAEKVKYEQRTKQPPLNKPESIEVKNAPTEAEMRKADETPVKKKFRIYNGATIYASDDLGKTVDVFNVKRNAKGEKYTVDMTNGKTAEIKTEELSYKQLKSVLSSYTNVSNKKENLQTVQKNRTVSENKAKSKAKTSQNFQEEKTSQVFNGEIRVYHGTANGEFDSFDNSKSNHFVKDREGIYTFTDSQKTAVQYTYDQSNDMTSKNSYVYGVKIKAKNVLIIDADGHYYKNIDASKYVKAYKGRKNGLARIKTWYSEEGKYGNSFFEPKSADINGIVIWAKQNGYDGVAIYNVYDTTGLHNEFSVFDSKNIEILDRKRVKEGVAKETGKGSIVLDDNGKVIEHNDKKVNKTKSEQKNKKGLKTDKTAINEEKSQKAEKKSVYKDLKTTKDIVDQTIKNIEKTLGEGYKVVPPVNMKDFEWRTFTDINQVQDAEKQAARLVNKMLETTIYTNESEYVSLEELFNDTQIEDLKKAALDIINSAPNTKARTAATRLLEVQNEKLADMAREFKKGQGRTRVFVRLRDSARKQAGRVFEITGNRIAKDGIYALLDSVKEIHSNGDTFSAKNLRDNTEETLKWYNEDDVIEKYEDLPFRSEIREALIELRDSVGKSIVKANGTVAKNVTTETMQKAIDFIRLVKAEINRMYKNSIDKYLPASVQTVAAMNSSNYGKARNVISRYVNMYKRGFAPYYAVLEEILGGNSAAARILIYDMQNGTNKKTLYVGTYHDLINKKLKELNLKKNFDSKKLSIRGQEITIDQAMGLYLSTQVDANFKAMDESGVKLYDTKLNKTVEFAKAGEAAALKAEIENLLPEDYKKLANYLLETLNGSIKGEYIDWYENKFGKYNRRNEIGEIGANTYWMLARSYQKATNLSKAVSNPDAVFSHSISRTDTNDNSVLITGALSSFDAYINKLGRELYVKPVYEDAIQTLNAKFKGGKSIAEAINDRNDGSKDFQLLKSAMKEILEANRREANTLDRMVSAFSVAKLSLNIGSMMKQFASAFTSNIPIRKTAKALIERWSPEARAEFKKLFDGVWDATKKEWTIEPIGGLKYRAANEGVLNANADSAGQLTKKIARVGMLGISKVDMFTVSTGVYSLMVIGQDQFKAKIGTQANIDFVKEHWAEYELSQIGNTALSKNAITTGDSLVRYLFGFLQGANRAALGSQIHKFGLWQRNRKLDKSQLQSDLKQAKADLETAKANYEANEDDEGARKAYVEANAKVLDLDNKLKDYKQYEIAGGKAIPVRMASGLLAQGILIALVNALMKRIKGKKEWDELNVTEEGLALAMAIGVDWIPLVNFAANIMQGYEVTIPAVNLFNQMSEIFKSGKAGNYRTTIRQIALLVGDMTGIPFQTVYSYIYGALKGFDPAIAYEMRSVLYGASLQSATKSMQEYASKGNEKKTTSMVGLIMNKYKTGSSTDEINKELADLYISGNNALPKTAMTQYTDDNGDVVQLTNEQVKQFTDIYSQSTKDVSELMKLTDYRSATNEEKAKAIKKIYDAYYALARAKVTGKQPEGKLAQILALTNGNIGLAKYILSLQKIANITQTSKKTRKELVLQYINRLRGYTKAEKTVLMYLAGYSVSGSSENLLISFLVRNGASRKDVKDLL